MTYSIYTAIGTVEVYASIHIYIHAASISNPMPLRTTTKKTHVDQTDLLIRASFRNLAQGRHVGPEALVVGKIQGIGQLVSGMPLSIKSKISRGFVPLIISLWILSCMASLVWGTDNADSPTKSRPFWVNQTEVLSYSIHPFFF